MSSRILVALPILLLSLATAFSAWQSLMGNLYHNVLVKEFTDVESDTESPKSVINISNIKESTQAMLNWAPKEPDYLIDASYASYLISLKVSSNQDKLKYLNESIAYLDQSIKLRPMFPDPYTQKADLMNTRGDKLSLIYTQLEKAYQYGPYEKDTAETSIKLLFSHWDSLSFEQKSKALKFITEHDQYGVPDWRLNEIFKFSPDKNRLCSVAILSQIPLWTCGNYKK
ncbi:hypothetical protein OAP63_15120 [Vibrio sp.]|nr:hypothetical protein [Vibrio sp.]